MKSLITVLFLTLALSLSAQEPDIPVIINMKSGDNIEAKHLGQKGCGTNIYVDNTVFVKGKYLNTVTEIKEFNDISKLVFEGFDKQPNNSSGNQKATIVVHKKNGISVAIEDAEITMSCYGVGNKYNQLAIIINNPLTGKVADKFVDVKDIQSIEFK